MEIGPPSNRPIGRPIVSHRQAAPEPQAAPGEKRDIRDKVEISDNGRARLAEQADRELSRATSGAGQDGLDHTVLGDRLAEIRQRIESGYYDDPDVRRTIVDRMIEDLDQ